MENKCLICKASLDKSSRSYYCPNCVSCYLEIEIELSDEPSPLLKKPSFINLSPKGISISKLHNTESEQLNDKKERKGMTKKIQEEEKNCYRSTENRGALDESLRQSGKLLPGSKKIFKHHNREDTQIHQNNKEFQRSKAIGSKIVDNNLHGILQPEVQEVLSMPTNQHDDKYTKLDSFKYPKASPRVLKTTAKKLETSSNQRLNVDLEEYNSRNSKTPQISILITEDSDNSVDSGEEKSLQKTTKPKQVIAIDKYTAPKSPKTGQHIEKEQNVASIPSTINQTTTLNSNSQMLSNAIRTSDHQRMQLEEIASAKPDPRLNKNPKYNQEPILIEIDDEDDKLDKISLEVATSGGSENETPQQNLTSQPDFPLRVDEIDSIKLSSIDVQVIDMIERYIKFDLLMKKVNRQELFLWLREMNYKIPELFLEIVKNRVNSKKRLSAK